jgi:hypothetical protein
MKVEILFKVEGEPKTRDIILVEVKKNEETNKKNLPLLKIIFEDGSFGYFCMRNIVYLIPYLYK